MQKNLTTTLILPSSVLSALTPRKKWEFVFSIRDLTTIRTPTVLRKLSRSGAFQDQAVVNIPMNLQAPPRQTKRQRKRKSSGKNSGVSSGSVPRPQPPRPTSSKPAARKLAQPARFPPQKPARPKGQAKPAAPVKPASVKAKNPQRPKKAARTAGPLKPAAPREHDRSSLLETALQSAPLVVVSDAADRRYVAIPPKYV